jgi:2-polyprenyl-3-methyl-5-hydroxy-6-metoxy-1,4-benzoquinol methylase
MCSLKSTAIDRGWLKAGERLLVPRLAYPLGFDLPDVIHENNRSARDVVVTEALEGIARPQANPSVFGSEPEVVVAETDRYGIPLRTVLGTQSGLMRSDPYYGEDYLARFYREHYRKLYRPRRFSLAWFFAEQIRSGQRIMERVEQKLPRRARVLDVGCGMGGMLIPFRFAGHVVAGCDYGEEYARHGWNVGLDIRVGGPETLAEEERFDLVILSHVLEHVTDPVKFLAGVAALVKPGGVCHIEVPGLLNLEQWYKGDILEYLQNAHRWHFTAATLETVARRAGLAVVECDQTIVCLASPACTEQNAAVNDGPKVLAEIARLEAVRAAGRN